MSGMAKLIMVLGVIIFIVGFLMQFISIGKLPGDLVIKRGNTTFYFPIVTSILVSVILSVVFYFLGKFR